MDSPIIIIWESALPSLGELEAIVFFFDEISLSKQRSPRWDAAFCGITNGAILFAYAPLKGRQAYTSEISRDARKLVYGNQPDPVRHKLVCKVTKEG